MSVTDHLLARIRELEAEVERLTADRARHIDALREYGRHKRGCTHDKSHVMNDDPPCSCGWTNRMSNAIQNIWR